MQRDGRAEAPQNVLLGIGGRFAVERLSLGLVVGRQVL